MGKLVKSCRWQTRRHVNYPQEIGSTILNRTFVSVGDTDDDDDDKVDDNGDSEAGGSGSNDDSVDDDNGDIDTNGSGSDKR